MNQYLCTLQAAQIGLIQAASEEERKITQDHTSYMQNLAESGVSLFQGTTKVQDSRYMGIFIFQAQDDTEARSIIEQDPVIQNRLMRGCLYPFRIALWNAEALELEEGQQHYLYHIQAVRPEQVHTPTEWEQEKTAEHFRYLKEQTEQGIFCIVGRTQNEDYSTFGLGVLRASSLDQAWEIGKRDPTVPHRVMRLDVLPFSVGI